MSSNKLTPQQMFKAAQCPVSWLLSAENLQEVAEAAISHEDQFLVPYLRAHEAATQEALAKAYAEGRDAGTAEIRARTPNYRPAQVLYAYAIENVLKGLIVANDPSTINSDKLNAVLKKHDLLELARTAALTVHAQEEPVLGALSELSVWAGRYPVAAVRDGAWLEARYRSHPERRYVAVAAGDRSDPAAWGAFAVRGRTTRWVDLVWDGRDRAALEALDRAAVEIAAAAGSARMELWLSGDDEAAEALVSRGWRALDVPLSLTTVTFAPDLDGRDLASRFYVTIGDSDHV